MNSLHLWNKSLKKMILPFPKSSLIYGVLYIYMRCELVTRVYLVWHTTPSNFKEKQKYFLPIF